METVRHPILAAPAKVERVTRAAEETEVERNVLDAIERVLAEVSVHQLSVERILEEAGTSRATFYRYFDSKWSVVAAALERAVIELFEASESFLAAPEDEDPIEALTRAMYGTVAIYRRHRQVFRAAMQYWYSIPVLGQLWQHFLDQQINALSAFITEQREVGRAVSGPPADRLGRVLVWTAVHSFITAAATYEDDDEAENRLVPDVGHLWALAIYGRPLT
jgi:AcrR family transcriptional regulator